MTGRDIACVAVAIAGVAIVILGSTGRAGLESGGRLLALLAVLTFTAYFLLTKRVRARGGTLDYMTVVHLVAGDRGDAGRSSAIRRSCGLSTRDIADRAVFRAGVGDGGSWCRWAHRYVDVSVSSLMLLGVPVVAAVAAWAMLDEALTPVQIAGGVITLLAIGAMVWRRAAGRSTEAAPTTGVATPQPAPRSAGREPARRYLSSLSGWNHGRGERPPLAQSLSNVSIVAMRPARISRRGGVGGSQCASERQRRERWSSSLRARFARSGDSTARWSTACRRAA